MSAEKQARQRGTYFSLASNRIDDATAQAAGFGDDLEAAHDGLTWQG